MRIWTIVCIYGVLLGGCATNPISQLKKSPSIDKHSKKNPMSIIACIGPKWAEHWLKRPPSTIVTENGYIMSIDGEFGPEGTVSVETEGSGSRVKFVERFHLATWMPDVVNECTDSK